MPSATPPELICAVNALPNTGQIAAPDGDVTRPFRVPHTNNGSSTPTLSCRSSVGATDQEGSEDQCRRHSAAKELSICLGSGRRWTTGEDLIAETLSRSGKETSRAKSLSNASRQAPSLN
jgi:hypothetical protein